MVTLPSTTQVDLYCDFGTSRKYLISEHHFKINLKYFIQKLQTIGRYTFVILISSCRISFTFGYHYILNLRYFFQKLETIVRHTIVILLDTSRKYLIFGHYYRTNLIYFLRKFQNIG